MLSKKEREIKKREEDYLKQKEEEKQLISMKNRRVSKKKAKKIKKMLTKYKDQDEDERAEAMKLMGVFFQFSSSLPYFLSLSLSSYFLHVSIEIPPFFCL